MTQHTKRIDFMDGLRGLAIMLVALFHYLARWAPPIIPTSFYPYDDAFAGFPVFKYGYLGVTLFFMISGFVIFLTLDRSKNIGEFAVRRWSRLFPAMLVCSLVTWGMAQILPEYPFSKKALDILPGVTFIPSDVWARLLGRGMQDIAGAYWSLYIEVQFYVMVSVTYFVLPRRFVLAALTAGILAVIAYCQFRNQSLHIIFSHRILNYIPWFGMGMAAYCLYRGENKRIYAGLFLLNFCAAWVTQPDPVQLYVPLLLFGIPFLVRPVRHVLAHRVMVFIGGISYPLYLVHENIGVAVLKISRHHMHGVSGVWLVFVVLAVLGAFSYLVAKYIELPVQHFVRTKLLPKSMVESADNI